MKRPTYARDLLARAAAESVSLAGVLRRLGIPESTTTRTRLRRSLAAYGIDTGHFTGQGYARGVPSPHRLSADRILRRKDVGERRTKTAQLRRALDDLEVPHVCVGCGLGDMWQGRRLVLEIDHVNGDRLDNRRENLRYLCPSCHSQTRTFANPSRRPATLRNPVQ
ncbi:HNH endonuclease [Streptomyces sp. NPDC021020]|uniref:HNH endonuclease n=1 Tax=Streptomyces sp. NPDC021020 TaxID=3365109 RepID=UPI003788BD32